MKSRVSHYGGCIRFRSMPMMRSILNGACSRTLFRSAAHVSRANKNELIKKTKGVKPKIGHMDRPNARASSQVKNVERSVEAHRRREENMLPDVEEKLVRQIESVHLFLCRDNLARTWRKEGLQYITRSIGHGYLSGFQEP
jgi:hypothetical protein